jgi:S-formylglutathione hydrolase FrmB
MLFVSRRMSRIVGAVLLTTGLLAGSARAATPAAAHAANDGARVTAQKWLSPHMFDLTVSSPALGSSAAMIRVIVPKGWTAGAKRTWPVLYAYQGGNDTYVSWTRSTDIAAVASHYGVMVVMPEGGTDGSFTNWFNYGKGGTPKWETFHTSEVLQLMERNYHAGTRRAVMGISSGGGGAMTYAARHPGMFRYAASYSGVTHLTGPGIPAFLMAGDLTFKGLDPFRIWGVPGVNDTNWRAHDPYVLAAHLRGTGLYVSSGTTGLPSPIDPPVNTGAGLIGAIVGGAGERIVGTMNTSFVARLRQLHIPVTTDLYGNGLHDWNQWIIQMHRSWPLMMRTIGAPKLN